MARSILGRLPFCVKLGRDLLRAGQIPILKRMKKETADPVLRDIVHFLTKKQGCHTVILYGSRARGAGTATSDYDVAGIRTRGAKSRVAKKVKGAYWDIFIYPERDLRKLGSRLLDWRGAQVVCERGDFGRRLVRRVEKLVAQPFEPAPAYEIAVTREWARKQLARIAVKDVHGLFRRSELQTAAIEHYFEIRKKRYWGPKAGLLWLEEHDPATYCLFARMYGKPGDEAALRALVKRVYRL